MSATTIIVDGQFLGVSILLISGVIACFLSYNAGVDVGRDRGRLEAYEDEDEEEAEGGGK